MKSLFSWWVLCLLAALPHARATHMQTVIQFAKESSRDWQSGVQPAKIRPQKNHAELALNFTRDDRQITLSRKQRLDLSALTSFRLRTGIQNPRFLLEGSLSFKSGNGWYIHTFTLHEAGYNHLLFNKQDFKPEGSPSGWNRIEEIRFSFWPRQKGSSTLQLVSLDGFIDTLWLINPESLAVTADETYTSRVSFRHFGRLLNGIGMPHAVKSIEDLHKNAPTPSLIILPYLPKLPAPQYQQLNRLIDLGTKVIVFEGEHQGFARKLGVDLGTPISSSTVGQFDHWNSSRENFPTRIYQHAWSLRTIRPLAGSTVTASWQNALDRDTRQPACIESSRGVWSNVAWRSGDLAAKQQALIEWIGRLDPDLITEPIRYYVETRSPQQFEIRYGPVSTKPGPAQHLKSMALDIYRKALLSSTFKIKTLRDLQESNLLMQRAFASSQPEWDAEIKGIWDQNGTGFFVGSWDLTCQHLKAAGFNAVFPNMASAGRAHYPSRLIPPSKSLEKYGDQLRAFTAAAHKHGLQAHPWKICWKLNTRLPAFHEKMRREGRLMQDANGKEIPWLSFSHPDNVQFEIDSLLEMARHAPIDGIHLDYMRYPGKEADYGPAARAAFEKRIGRRLQNWPREVLTPGGLKDEFQRFRQQELHQAMQKISEALKSEFPQLKLSVAVWGAWPDCADAQGQDWPVWAKYNWVDWIIPMNYTDNPDQFDGWLDLQRAQPGVSEKLLPGIGLISSNAELSPSQVLIQLDSVKARKLKGAVLYRLDPSLETRLFPYLKIWK
ncbi:family 10 glycosylhydrolase [Kiritimatiellaeota bacterium B1221]|nr:family 10 glycosylhydrolase [Kiritimatiellaeota bacterium B1221]